MNIAYLAVTILLAAMVFFPVWERFVAIHIKCERFTK